MVIARDAKLWQIVEGAGGAGISIVGAKVQARLAHHLPHGGGGGGGIAAVDVIAVEEGDRNLLGT